MSKKLKKSNDYSFFFNNLIDVCERHGTSPTALAEKYAAKSVLTAWKHGKIDTDIVSKLSLELNVSTDYLITGKEKTLSLYLSKDEQELLENFNKLTEREQVKLIGVSEYFVEQSTKQVKAENNKPKISMITINIAEVAAGAGVSTPFTIDNAFSPRDFPSDVVPDEAECGVPINGDSMEPQYPNGCIAWVKCTDTADPGDVIIAVLNGEPYCKIYQQDGLHSYNKNYEIIRVNEQDNFYIFGKVVGNFMG